MQSTTLSMSSARFEATTYSTKNSKSSKGYQDRTETNNLASAHANRNSSAFLLDIESLKQKNFSSFGSYISSESYKSEQLEEFRLSIQSMTIETFTEQNGEFKNINKGFRISFTSIEISFSGSADKSSSLYDDVFGEDAYWGAEKTSQRLFDFAKSLAGNDPEKLEQAREGALKGYKSVEKLVGQMPQVCVDTLDMFMEKIDLYKEEISPKQPINLTA